MLVVLSLTHLLSFHSIHLVNWVVTFQPMSNILHVNESRRLWKQPCSVGNRSHSSCEQNIKTLQKVKTEHFFEHTYLKLSSDWDKWALYLDILATSCYALCACGSAVVLFSVGPVSRSRVTYGYRSVLLISRSYHISHFFVCDPNVLLTLNLALLFSFLSFFTYMFF